VFRTTEGVFARFATVVMSGMRTGICSDPAVLSQNLRMNDRSNDWHGVFESFLFSGKTGYNKHNTKPGAVLEIIPVFC